MRILCHECNTELEIKRTEHFGSDLTIYVESCGCTDMGTCDLQNCSEIIDLKKDHKDEFENLVKVYGDFSKELEKLKRKYVSHDNKEESTEE